MFCFHYLRMNSTELNFLVFNYNYLAKYMDIWRVLLSPCRNDEVLRKFLGFF